MNYKPCGDKILVKNPDIKSLEKTKSGILVPGPSFADHIWAEVVEVSDGFTSESGALCHISVKVGDVVAFHKGVGAPVILDDENYLLIRDIDVHMRKKRKDEDEEKKENSENPEAFMVDADSIKELPDEELKEAITIVKERRAKKFMPEEECMQRIEEKGDKENIGIDGEPICDHRFIFKGDKSGSSIS